MDGQRDAARRSRRGCSPHPALVLLLLLVHLPRVQEGVLNRWAGLSLPLAVEIQLNINLSFIYRLKFVINFVLLQRFDKGSRGSRGSI